MARPRKVTTDLKVSPQPIDKIQKKVDLNVTDKKIKTAKQIK